MRNADRFDLAELDVYTIELPTRGERLMRDIVASRLGLRLRASGSRTWIMFQSQGGKTIRRTLGEVSTIPVASARLMAAAEMIRATDHHRTTAVSGAQFQPDARVSEVLSRYLAYRAKGRWKASTGRMMESVGRTCIIPLLGTKKVREITQEDIARWYRDITAQTTSARMALSTLSGMMRYAEDHGLRPTGSNPCRGLRKKETGHRGRHLSPGTVCKLWIALDRLQSSMPAYCDAVRLLLLTGARRSEILSLTWDRIVGPRAVLEDSKGGPRTIWLNTPARQILDDRRAASASEYVFPSPRLDAPIKVLDAPWRAILREAGVIGLRVHDLRHHFASVGVSNGIDIRLVGQLLGHHDIDSTLGYAHLAAGALSKSASRVSTFIDHSMRQNIGPSGSTPLATRGIRGEAVTSAREARHA